MIRMAGLKLGGELRVAIEQQVLHRCSQETVKRIGEVSSHLRHPWPTGIGRAADELHFTSRQSHDKQQIVGRRDARDLKPDSARRIPNAL